MVDASAKDSATHSSSLLQRDMHTWKLTIVTAGLATCLLAGFATASSDVSQKTPNPPDCEPAGVGHTSVTALVVVGRLIVAPGSLKGGGAMMVVEKSTVGPSVKVTEVSVLVVVESPGLVVVVTAPEVIDVEVVGSFIVAPGSSNGGGMIMVVERSTVGP